MAHPGFVSTRGDLAESQFLCPCLIDSAKYFHKNHPCYSGSRQLYISVIGETQVDLN